MDAWLSNNDRAPRSGVYEHKPDGVHFVPIAYEDYTFQDGRYEMDPDGNVYDNKHMCWVKPTNGTKSVEFPDENYLALRLHLESGKITRILWHRLVAATLIGDVTGMQVHHKDEHPAHCYPSNLEILEENEHHRHHAHGENNARSQLTEDEVRDVCRMLSDDISHTEISKIMSNRKGITIIPATINQIRLGKNWAYISKDYDFYRGPLEKPGRTPNPTVYGVSRARFEYLCAHLRLPAKTVADMIGVDISDPKVYKAFHSRVGAIRAEYDSRMYKLIPKKQPDTD